MSPEELEEGLQGWDGFLARYTAITILSGLNGEEHKGWSNPTAFFH